MKVLFVVILLIVGGVDGCYITPKTPAQRLCNHNESCMEVVYNAESSVFLDLKAAVAFSLAHLHLRSPEEPSEGVIFHFSEGYYVFRVGNISNYALLKSPKPIARVIAYINSNYACSWKTGKLPVYSQQRSKNIKNLQCGVALFH